jgi:hypothetical protein
MTAAGIPTHEKSPRLVMARAAANPVGGGRLGGRSPQTRITLGAVHRSNRLEKRKPPGPRELGGLRPPPALSGSADLNEHEE